MNQQKLTPFTLISYAATAIPLAMLGLPLYIYLPTFYAQSVGLSVTAVGIILFVSRLTDVITDPLVGLYSDRFQSKYGKRKPFMLLGAVMLIGSFYALIHPPAEHTPLWLLGFSMLVYLGWSIISIPYLAWSAEITSDYHEKTRLSAARELFTIIGALSALLIPYLYSVSEDADKSLNILYVAFLITLFIMLPLTLMGAKENATTPTQKMTFEKIRIVMGKKSFTCQSSIGFYPQLPCQCTACHTLFVLCRTCFRRTIKNRSAIVTLFCFGDYRAAVLDDVSQENRQT